MGSWIIHQTDRGAEDERCVLLVTNGYYWLLTVTNGYSGLLGARPGSFKNGRTAGHRGAFFGNHPLTPARVRADWAAEHYTDLPQPRIASSNPKGWDGAIGSMLPLMTATPAWLSPAIAQVPQPRWG